MPVMNNKEKKKKKNKGEEGESVLVFIGRFSQLASWKS